MQINYDPDENETVTERRTCLFHEMYPGEPFAGCTCSFSVSSRPRPPEEVAAIKAKRQREEENRILAEATLIRQRRKTTPPELANDEKDER